MLLKDAVKFTGDTHFCSHLNFESLFSVALNFDPVDENIKICGFPLCRF